jgi:hypothetical protein
LQGDALAFLVLRRKLSGKAKDPEAAEPIKQDLERSARNLASSIAPLTPNSSKALEGLAALQAVRDNHVFAALQQALTPGATAQVNRRGVWRLLIVLTGAVCCGAPNAFCYAM